jgi:type IV secretion system protein VirD4
MPSSVSDNLRFKKTRNGEPPHPYAVAGLGVAGLLGGLFAATQYVAYRLRYHPNLGPGLIARDAAPAALCLVAGLAFCALAVGAFRSPGGRRAAPAIACFGVVAFAAARGPIYAPTRVVQWGTAFHRTADQHVWAQLQPIFDTALPVGIAGFTAALVAAATLLFGGSVKRASNAHGTAEFGTGDELLLDSDKEQDRQARRIANEVVEEPGLMVGRQPAKRPTLPWGASRPGRLLWYHGPSHVLTMAPTRSGKGVGAVIPSLLRYPGSAVVIDIKGENFHVTHKQRLRDGGDVFVLDPFRVTGDHMYHAYANPLDSIDTVGETLKDRALDDCKTLAEMLVEEDGKENRHFSDEGRSLLACFMLYVCHKHRKEPHLRTLMQVRELLTLPEEAFGKLLEDMAQSDHALVRRGIARLEQKEERERTGVISTAQRGIDFLDSVPMARVLVPPSSAALTLEKPEHQTGHVNLGLLKGERQMTLYFVIPPEALKTHAAWIRMMIACINNMITRIPGRPSHRILMLLDEFAQLGHIRPVVEGISLVGGYGVLFWVIVQDLAQLKGLYRDNWETIFANCDVKQCFGTNDWTTAELLSKMAGETTVFTESGSTGKGRSFGKSSGHSTNYGESVSEKGRRLLMPDEVMRLATSKQLLFVKGSEPLLVDKINYLADPEFRTGTMTMFDANPMYA